MMGGGEGLALLADVDRKDGGESGGGGEDAQAGQAFAEVVHAIAEGLAQRGSSGAFDDVQGGAAGCRDRGGEVGAGDEAARSVEEIGSQGKRAGDVGSAGP